MNLKQLRELAEAALDGDPLTRFEYFQQIQPCDTTALLDLIELARKEMLVVHPADAAVFLEAYDALNKEGCE